MTLTPTPWAAKTGDARFESHLAGVGAVVSSLRDQNNWYLDLSNERNNLGPGFVSFEQLRKLRDEARRLKPNLLVTASHWGDIPRDSMAGYVLLTAVAFLSPQGERSPRGVQERDHRTEDYYAWMESLGKVVPVHYQEPLRRDFVDREGNDWQPEAKDFIEDLERSQKGGAAGWCFHNGDNRFAGDRNPQRSFDLRTQRLFGQFDSVEKQVLRLSVRNS